MHAAANWEQIELQSRPDSGRVCQTVMCCLVCFDTVVDHGCVDNDLLCSYVTSLSEPLTFNKSKNLHFSLTCSPLKGHDVESKIQSFNIYNFNEAIIQSDITISSPKMHSAP